MRTKPFTFAAVGLVGLAVLLAVTPARADSTKWIGPDGGNWSNSDNWTNGVPGNAGAEPKQLVQNSGFVGTWNLDADWAITKWTVGSDNANWTLDLNGFDLSTGNTEWFRDVKKNAVNTIGDSVGGGTITFGGQIFYRGGNADAERESSSIVIADAVQATCNPPWPWGPGGWNTGYNPGDCSIIAKDQSSLEMKGGAVNIGNEGYPTVSAPGEGLTVTISARDEARVWWDLPNNNVNLGSTPESMGGGNDWVDNGYGRGWLEVIGNAASIDMAGGLTIGKGGVRVEIDDLAQDAAIDVGKSLVLTTTQTAEIDVDLATGVTPSFMQVFDLIDWGTGDAGATRTGSFTLVSEDVGTWQLIHDDTNKVVQAQYLVPEPATAIVVLSGAVLAMRRRRF